MEGSPSRESGAVHIDMAGDAEPAAEGTVTSVHRTPTKEAYQKECRDLGRPVPGFLLGKDAAGHVAPHEAVQTIMQQLSANGDLGHFAAPVVPGPPHVEAMRLQRILWAAEDRAKQQDGQKLGAADAIRHVLSALLSIGALFIIVFGVAGDYAVLAGPSWLLFLILIVCVVLLAYLEGLQVAILALEKSDCREFRESHPRAVSLHELTQKGRNVERFLVGRQFFVVFVVYLTAQITTFPEFTAVKDALPEWLYVVAIDTGLPGALTVLAFGQLLPQLVAATHPVSFMNLRGSRFVVYIALGLEWVGITHFSWLISALAKRLTGLKGRQIIDAAMENMLLEGASPNASASGTDGDEKPEPATPAELRVAVLEEEVARLRAELAEARASAAAP